MGMAGAVAGTMGAAGAAGDNGAAGTAGMGMAGDMGMAGASGTMGTAGASGTTGAAGAAGAGTAGTGGAGGVAGGTAGVAGTAGAAGSGTAGTAGAGGVAGGTAGAGGAAGSGAAGTTAMPTLYSNWCSPVHWSYTTNPAAVNAMDFPSNVSDGSIASRWSTGANQTPGQYFQIDFGGTVSLTQVVLDDTNNAGDFPRGYDIGLSANGTTFTSVATKAANANVVVTEAFGAAPGRYLRITQTGTFNNWWSIDELKVTCSVPGYVAGQIDPYDPQYWTASASRTANNGDSPAKAIDADATTRWSTGGPMAAGDSFTVDMGGVAMISGVNYNCGGGTDFPVAYKLELSTDCTNYTQATTGAGNTGITKVTFARQNARCFRITQTATTGTSWWSIYGITLTP
jgi:beta-glucosidase